MRYTPARTSDRIALSLLLALLAILALAAIFAPWLAPHDPASIQLSARLLSPGSGHLFGTDELGRDIFSRVLFGARISLGVATTVVALSLVVGTVVGAVAGFYGGWRDTVLNLYVMNAFLALPGILLAIARVAGETAPLLFTSLGNQNWSVDHRHEMASLPLAIYTDTQSAYADLQQLAWVGALLITAGVLAINIIARVALRRRS